MVADGSKRRLAGNWAMIALWATLAVASPHAAQELTLPSPTYDQQVFWLLPGGAQSLILDTTQAATTLPRRVGDGRRSFSFHCEPPDGDSGTSVGSLSLELSNAPVSGGKIVLPTKWVVQTSLTLDIGGKDILPSMQAVLINFAGWARLTWTPGSNSSGNLQTFFDGVRL